MKSSLIQCPCCLNSDTDSIKSRDDGFLFCVRCGGLFVNPNDSNEEKRQQALDFNNADILLRYSLPNFAEAEHLFKQLTTKYKSLSIAYWGYVRAKNEIKYEYDERGHITPICYSGLFHDFRNDKEYLKALELAESAEIRKDYQRQADYIIEEWKYASKDLGKTDYDVFISFKDTLDDSDPNHIIKNEKDKANILPIVNLLMSRGYKVFYSPMSIPKGGYPDPFIYNAIKKSKMMIVFGSNVEYFESTWVKNEWTRYYALIEKHDKKRGSLISVVDGVEPYRLPKILRDIQVINFDINASAEILDLARKFINEEKEKKPLEVKKEEPETIVCPNCSQVNPITNKFCFDCGANLKKNNSQPDLSDEQKAKKEYEIGMEYYNKKDYANAIKHFEIAAKKEHPDACFRLGFIYDSSTSPNVTKDDVKAAGYYKVAATHGDMYAQYNLGLMYDNGRGVNKDVKEAARLYKLAADQGHASSQFCLGYDYEKGIGVEQNYTEAIKYYKLAADQGHAGAQCNLGLMYKNGQGVSQSYTEAVRLYKLSADQGNMYAQNNLGLMYENGQGVPQNLTEAVRLYKLSADQGYMYAQCNLGFMYARGQGVPQSYTEAVRLYKLSADQGYDQAQHNLGVVYNNGQGVPQNYTEAIKYYKLAADQGHAGAQCNLGLMYNNGQGVPQNYTEAVRLYKLSADQGNMYAQRNLGIMYENGQGVPQNLNEAIKYYKLAAAQGYEKAINKLKELGIK